MGRKLTAAAAAVLVAAALAAGFYYRRNGKTSAEEAPKTYKAFLGPVEESVETTGEVVPLNRVEIKPPISGRVETLLIDEGAQVKAGQVLAWMSSSDRAAILDAARAKGPEEVKRWEDTYRPTPIVAPLSGTVILRNVVVGQTVDGGTVLFAMADKLIVLAHVGETDIGRVKVGMAVGITLDAYPDSTVKGRVSNVLYEGKNVSNVITYGVKVEPQEVPPFFRSQMTANIRLIVHSKADAVLVPSSAVSVDREGEKRVFVPGEDGKPRPLRIRTGVETAENVEVLEGLSAGDEVVVARRRYRPQQAAGSSPLTPFGGRGAGGRSGSGSPGGARSGGGGRGGR